MVIGTPDQEQIRHMFARAGYGGEGVNGLTYTVAPGHRYLQWRPQEQLHTAPLMHPVAPRFCGWAHSVDRHCVSLRAWVPRWGAPIVGPRGSQPRGRRSPAPETPPQGWSAQSGGRFLAGADNRACDMGGNKNLAAASM